MVQQESKRGEGERLKQTLLEKNELHRQTLQQRQQDSALVKMDLDGEKQRAHDYATRNAEISILKKDAENQLSSLNDQQSILMKEYNNVKRVIKKRRTMADETRGALPRLDEILFDEEVSLKAFEQERMDIKNEITALKNEMDERVAEFLQLEGVQQDKKQVIYNSNTLLFSFKVMILNRSWTY